jgi:rhodanese-related sulfurtransferase
MEICLVKKSVLAAAFAAVLSSSLVAAPAHAELNKKKQTELGLYLTASEAFTMVKGHEAETLFLDVRTRAEVAFLGMPTIADANLPYLLAGDWSEWDEGKKNFKHAANSGFLPAVEDLLAKKGLTKESKIVVMCRSGSRSAKAANLLAQAGYKNVYTVTDGYEGDTAKEGEHKGERVVNGWKNSGLPWSYKLDKEKMYWEM